MWAALKKIKGIPEDPELDLLRAGKGREEDKDRENFAGTNRNENTVRLKFAKK
jgi:hypothetical protein